ncbi:AraC family transcriptional regulator [Paenibacillus sp.]|uniref:AraC family transcriptional regulator n=1 Tax=Paenibacillus sp. TaxID=58172 RepID=UPI002D52E0E6|nr:AraC family transcriptional regulator [Paenibacillus sp.]HZG56963.1 AraC family transcriptional regulator [Paenibacillus sp.]
MLKGKESEERLNRTALTLPGVDATFRVHFWGVDQQHYDNPVHKHSFFEVCYVCGGEGIYEEKGTLYALREGVLFCSRPGVVHQIRSSTGLSLWFVAFELDESRSTPAEAERFRRLAEDAEVCVRGAGEAPTVALWKALMLTDQDHLRLSDAAVVAAAQALLRSFADVFSPRRPAASARRGSSSDMLLRRAKLFIRDNLERPITLAHVADYLHVSERHVSRVFAEGIHESFNGYVRKERIRQAAYLLTRTDEAIKDIAERTGFGTVHSFSRAFARETGLPPGRYREERSV